MTLDEYEKNKFLAGDKIVNSDIFCTDCRAYIEDK